MFPDVSERSEDWTSVAGVLLRMNVVRVTANGLERPVLAASDDDLVLLVQLRLARRPDSGTRQLAIELLRGDASRDHWRGRVESSQIDLALRLTWGSRACASSRLVCRVLLDGVELARRTLLLGRPAVDAQGRMALEATPNASQATLLAYLNECHRAIAKPP